MKITLHELAKVVGGVGNYHQFPNEVLGRIRTDSRTVERGDVFVCLPGERFDGHNFVRDALSRGVKAVVADRPMPHIGDSCALIIVKDTYKALRDIASYFRNKFKGRVIGITGSCGKTSVKEFIYSILSTRYRVGKNFKNWNNLVGVPLSIFDFKGDEDFWILEAGINQMGEMDLLASMISPDIVVIHNIGPVHLEGLGSVEGVADEKTRFMDFISPGGFAIINRQYPLLVKKAEERDKEVIWFGPSTPYQCFFLGYDMDFRGIFNFLFEGTQTQMHLPLGGSILEENLTAASVCAYRLGFTLKEIAEGFSQVRLPEHRMHVFKVGKLLVVDDCYNANPISMDRSLRDMKRLREDVPFVAILGDMLELGKDAPHYHYELGRLVGEVGVDILLYKGEFFDKVREGVMTSGAETRVYPVSGIRDFETIWREIAPREAVVLLKASRGMRLDVFLRVIKEGVL